MRQYFTLVLFGLIISFLAHGCYEIDDNRRVLIIGQLVDDTDNPLEGITIESRGEGRLLGSAISDAEGNFNFTSLESNAQDFTILINPQTLRDSLYTSVIYRNNPQAASEERIEYVRELNLYDLEKLRLYQPAHLNFEIRRTSNTQDTLYYTLETASTVCEQFYTNDQLDATRANCYEPIVRSGVLLPEALDSRFNMAPILRSPARFTYHVNNEEDKELQIPISQKNASYVFEF